MAKHTNLKSLFTAIADAIRSKTGETSTIVADDFPDAISAIETHEDEDAIVDGSITSYTNDRVKYINDHAFYNHGDLTEVCFANVERVGDSAFENCDRLRTVYMPSVTQFDGGTFCGCLELYDVYCPLVESVGPITFAGTKLEILDIYSRCTMGSCVFENAHIKALVLRSESSISAIVSDTFAYSNFASGSAYIYVPSVLVEQYKAAVNWSNYANQIRALEDYTVDGTITGKLSNSKI